MSVLKRLVKDFVVPYHLLGGFFFTVDYDNFRTHTPAPEDLKAYLKCSEGLEQKASFVILQAARGIKQTSSVFSTRH